MVSHTIPRLGVVLLAVAAVAAPSAFAIAGGVPAPPSAVATGHTSSPGYTGGSVPRRTPAGSRPAKRVRVEPVPTGANGVVCFPSPPIPC